jgi:hypothetical protein
VEPSGALDARELHHLRPLLGFCGDELTEVVGRTRKRFATQIGKPRLDLGIGEADIDFSVELVDDLGGRVLRAADAEPGAPVLQAFLPD